MNYNISAKVGDCMNEILKFVDESGILLTENVIKVGYNKPQLSAFI